MQLEEDVALAAKTTLGVGGPAKYFVRAHDEATLLEAVRWADRYGVPLFVLGGGSNLVISDAGVDGVVVEVCLKGIELQRDGERVRVHAQAGEPWDDVVALAVKERLAGLECLSGVPGRVGATPIQNVGAYGQDVSETVCTVRAFDRKTDAVVELNNAECAFAYRDSRFKSGEPGRFVVLGVSYALVADGRPQLRYAELERALANATEAELSLAAVRDTVLKLRRAKSMVLDASDPNAQSCGSFFVNPVVDTSHAERLVASLGDTPMPRYPTPDGRVKLSAGWLIEQSGFPRGTARGLAALSSKHALALTARPGARAEDVLALARDVRRAVEARFDVRLVPEPVCWGFFSLDDGLPDDRLA